MGFDAIRSYDVYIQDLEITIIYSFKDGHKDGSHRMPLRAYNFTNFSHEYLAFTAQIHTEANF